MTLETVFNFITIGFFANILSILVVWIVDMIKISFMRVDEKIMTTAFHVGRYKLMSENSILYNLYYQTTLLLPFYLVGISLIRLYYYCIFPGFTAVVIGTAKADQFCIIPLIDINNFKQGQ